MTAFSIEQHLSYLSPTPSGPSSKVGQQSSNSCIIKLSSSLPFFCALVLFGQWSRLMQNQTMDEGFPAKQPPLIPETNREGASRRTLRHADLLPVFALELVLFEGALPLLDVGFLLVLVQVQDEEAELALEHVLLPLGQLLLALPQELLVGLLLQRGSLQLLLAATQLLVEEERGEERWLAFCLVLYQLVTKPSQGAGTAKMQRMGSFFLRH